MIYLQAPGRLLIAAAPACCAVFSAQCVPTDLYLVVPPRYAGHRVDATAPSPSFTMRVLRDPLNFEFTNLNVNFARPSQSHLFLFFETQNSRVSKEIIISKKGTRLQLCNTATIHNENLVHACTVAPADDTLATHEAACVPCGIARTAMACKGTLLLLF